MSGRVILLRWLRGCVGTLAVAGILACIAPGTLQAQTPLSPALPAPSGSDATGQMQMPDMANQVFTRVLFNQFEGRAGSSNSEFRWDGEGWIGTDLNRLWFKSEGFANSGTVSDSDIEAFYDHPLPRLRYFDGQVGIREDVDSGPQRTWLALGMEGLAPGFFQFEPTLYLRDGGHVAGRIVTSYDLLLTQRLIAEPQLEMNFYSRRDLQSRLGTGLSDLDTGLRLRYEISRKYAPYIGFAYSRKFGTTATLLRGIGQNAEAPAFVFGLRFWY